MALVETKCRGCGKLLMSSTTALSSENPVGIICSDCATPEQEYLANLAAGRVILKKLES